MLDAEEIDSAVVSDKWTQAEVETLKFVRSELPWLGQVVGQSREVLPPLVCSSSSALSPPPPTTVLHNVYGVSRNALASYQP